MLLDVLHHPRPCHIPLEAIEDESQALTDVEALEHFVLVGDAEIHVRRRQVGEPARIRDVHLEDRGHFVGNALAVFREGLRRPDDAGDEVVHLGRIGGALLGRPNAGDRVGVQALDVVDHDAPKPLERDLHGLAREIDSLMHSRSHAHTSDEFPVLDGLVVIAMGDYEGDNEPGLVVRAQQGQIFGRAHLHGDGAERVDNGRAERHERQRRRQLRAEDFFFALGFGHLAGALRSGSDA